MPPREAWACERDMRKVEEALSSPESGGQDDSLKKNTSGVSQEENDDASWQTGLLLALVTFLAVAVPDAVLVVVAANIGYGSKFYNSFASSTSSWAGNGAACLAGFSLMVMFIGDIQRRGACVQAVLVIVFVMLVLATGALKSAKYPIGVQVACLCLTALLLGCMRSLAKKNGIAAKTFFRISGASLLICAVLAAVCWLCGIYVDKKNGGWYDDDMISELANRNADVWRYASRNLDFTVDPVDHCASNAVLTNYTKALQAKISRACKSATTVGFMQFSAPFLVSISNLIAACFCFLWASSSPKFASQQEKLASMKAVLRNCVLVAVGMMTLLYASFSYLSGASVSLGSVVFCLAAMIMATLIGYVYLEFDLDLMREQQKAKSSPLANQLLKIVQSDWAKAMAVGFLNVFIPIGILLDMSRKCIRRCTGASSRASMSDKQVNDNFTKEGRQVVDELKTWNWSSIFTKINLLGIAWVVTMVGSKLTFVFFSWLNETLKAANMGFGLLVLLVALISYGMFMLPIVPGTAVYLFAGVVMGALSGDSVGFWPGVAIACVVCSIIKLSACTCQYGIGYAAGKSVQVQKFVGVDTVPTRAMEQILRTSGMGLGKVCILVAGPDFPTSMLCGILKLNIPQMLLGTLPVIPVTIVPQVLVGALLSKPGGGSGIWSMVSTAVTGGAAAFQGGAMLVFSYKIMKTVEKDSVELALPREEHEAVEALTKKEAEYNRAFKEVTTWRDMRTSQQTLLVFTTALFLIAGFMTAADFILTEKICFRKFSLKNKIDDPEADGGLDGSAHRIVIAPIGWIVLGLTLVGSILHWIFGKWMSVRAKAHVMTISAPEAPEGQAASSIGKSDDERLVQ